MSDRSDDELVRLFCGGDEAAFNELVLRYQEKIYWVARRFTGNHDQADDITQEVFCRMYESLAEFRGASSLYTWLYRIAVNVSLNFIRRQKVRDFLRIDEIFDIEAEKSESPDSVVEYDEQQSLVEEAVAKLPEKQKAVFVMRYYEELPYEEIAKILKTSVGGLKANYFHALRKVGEYLRRAHRTR
ncbi:MAG TPA: RNA polymerase sigma factor [Bacteroidota bacterium]